MYSSAVMFKIVCSILFLNMFICDCSDIFHENSKIVNKPDDASEYFGYTVDLSKNRLIVGAPKAKSRLNPGISPGQVFKCRIRDVDVDQNLTCVPLGISNEMDDSIFATVNKYGGFFKDDMWFGASVATLPNGNLLMCAPRWSTPYKDTHILANGACYMLSTKRGYSLMPLMETGRQAYMSDGSRPEYGEYGTHLNFYAYGQAGFSIKLTDSSIIIGAPGLLQWTGGIVEYRFIRFTYDYLSLQPPMNPYFTKDIGPDDYLGYSVEAGIFEENGTTLYVAGAPRSRSGYGQVLIIQPSTRGNDALKIKGKVIGPQLGAYFGATLCCTDIDGDGVTDLLVGAPNYVKKDGILHYDQGAVFVYLTKSQDTNFTLIPASYVIGSEQSGARFGSAIADLGDVDGDGFNDIAIGAPWEDGGKGAVYIYRGGKDGLRNQYEQKITVAEAKTFGFSISKGVDLDQNNCSDFAVGAFNSRAAYIYRCVPTVRVETFIKVPDAMNLPINATNFTALFCVKATPKTIISEEGKANSPMKLAFTARISIDTKQNRAQFKGDTEYDVNISAGNEKCDEQVVEVKPTADLSKPISMKFDLEEIDSLKGSREFPKQGARVSENSVLGTSFEIQLRRDCGDDLICKPLLELHLEALKRSYIPGTEDKLGFKVSVVNREEPSYGAKVHLTLPSSPQRLPHECSLEELNVTCDLPAPLSRNETVQWEIELEFNYKHSIKKELNVLATLEDPLYDGTDIARRREELSIVIAPEAVFEISGKALPNKTVAVTREKLYEAGNVSLVHYYEVTNFGPSDWFRLPIQVVVPEKVNLSNRIKGCLELGRDLECAWNLPAKVSMPIILPLRFDLGVHGKYLEEKNEFNITSTVIILLDGRNKTATITTSLVLEAAPSIWPYIVGGVAGLLLLAIITLVFYKYGFFSRKRLEDFKRLQEQEMTVDEASTSGVEEPSAVTDTSSQELILDDSE